jgi:hypothetical protein
MKHPIILVALLTTPAFAVAEDFNYSLLQINYGTVDFARSEIDCDGFGLNGSWGMTDRLHVTGGYMTADFFEYIADATEWTLGLGYNVPVSDRVDIVASASYINVDIEALPGQCTDCRIGFQDDGYGLSVGTRVAVFNKFEINADVSFVDLKYKGDEMAFGAGAMYNWTNRFSVGLAGHWTSAVASYQVSGRLYFN